MKTYAKGFTLIELIGVLFVILIFVILVVNVSNGFTNNNSISFGFNGMVETRCVDGFKVMIGQRGYVEQLKDEKGNGVKC